jgi:hypothetical protein
MFLTFSSTFVLSSLAVLCNGHESTRLLANSRGIEQPEFRYVEWGGIGDDQQAIAKEGLDYTKKTWNVPGEADVEKLAFSSLTAENLVAALALGFEEEVWDCYVNHYDDYSWADLETEGVQQYFITLGWTEDRWTDADATDPPESEDLFFDELSADQTIAAEEICYNELLWNGESLSGASTVSVLAAAIGAAVAGIFFM